MPQSWSIWSSRSPYIPSFGISNKCSMLIFAVLASTLSSLVVVTRVSFSIVGLKVEAFWVYECLGVGRKRLEFTKIVKSFTSWGRRKFLKVFLDYEMTPVQILEGKCPMDLSFKGYIVIVCTLHVICHVQCIGCYIFIFMLHIYLFHLIWLWCSWCWEIVKNIIFFVEPLKTFIFKLFFRITSNDVRILT